MVEPVDRRRKVNPGADARIAARGSVTSALMQLAGRVLGLVFVVVATRILDPAAFSRYSVVAALVVVGALLADFGINPMVVREVSRAPSRVSDVSAVAVPTSAGLGVVAYLAVVSFAWAAYPPTQAIDVAVGALAVPAGAVCGSLLSALDGVGLLGRHAKLAFLQSAVTAITGMLALAAGLGPRGVAGALALGSIVGLAVTVSVVRHHGVWTGALAPSQSEVRRFLRSARPFAAIGVISAVSLRFDVLLLSLLSPKRETAIYDISLRVVEAVVSFNTILTGPALYLFSGRFGQGDYPGTQRAFDETLRLAYLVGMPVSAVAVALRTELAMALFGEAFASADVPLAILGGHVWLALVGYVQGTLLLAGDHPRRGIVVAAAITGVVVVLDVVLIPWFGASGAAAAGLVTAVVTVVAFGRFHRSTSGLVTRLPPAGAAIAAIAGGGGAWLLREAGLPAALATAGVVYVTMLIVTRAVTRTDLERLHTILRGPPPP